MTNYFYIIGFLYIGDLLREIYQHIKRPKTDPNQIHIGGNNNYYDIMSQAHANMKKDKNSTIKAIIGLLFLAWTIIGTVMHTPEEMLFIINAALIFTYNAIIVISVLIVTLKSLIQPKGLHTMSEKTDPIQIPLTYIYDFSQLVVVLTILVMHYCN